MVEDILSHDSWGSDLDVHLMAIGVQRVIIVVTALRDGSTYARIYYSQPPPLPKIKEVFLFHYQLKIFAASGSYGSLHHC